MNKTRNKFEKSKKRVVSLAFDIAIPEDVDGFDFALYITDIIEREHNEHMSVLGYDFVADVTSYYREENLI